jgi:plasmid replication initiation protein
LGEKYTLYGELKRCVIDKSITEINSHSNITVNYGERRRGRKVKSLQFSFETKQKQIKEEEKTLTLEQFVRENPAKTKGKTELEVRKMMMKNHQ